MKQFLEACAAQAKKARRWLDERAWQGSLVVGMGLGVGLGALVLLGIGGWAGQGLCLLVLGLAVAAGINAQPILVGAPVAPKPKQSEIKPKPDWRSFKLRIVKDIPDLLEMVELPGGTFLMGSPDSDDQAYASEKPQHPVTISAFAMARFPVTRKLYRKIMGKGSSTWKQDKGDDLLPANVVTWFDAVEFCNALSRRQGLHSCYHVKGNQVEWDHKANGYRLPTEAEWEYAVRAGTTTQWFFGDNPAELGRYAWSRDNAEGRVHPVGEKEPNPWGLYELIGNVWEWCWDEYGDYSAGSASDPVGSGRRLLRVLRGGAFWVEPWHLRSAYRFRFEPEFRDDFIGFRCVRGPRRQP